eukprot:2632132-Pyramimonas_sp.AAC.1
MDVPQAMALSTVLHISLSGHPSPSHCAGGAKGVQYFCGAVEKRAPPVLHAGREVWSCSGGVSPS